MAIQRNDDAIGLPTGDRPSGTTSGQRPGVSYIFGVETDTDSPNRGVTYVYRRGQTPQGQQTPIGTISNISGGTVFTPNPGVRLTVGEEEYFSNADNSRTFVNNYSIPFYRRTIGTASQANNLFGSNLASAATEDSPPITATIDDNTAQVRRNYGHLFYPEAIRGNKQDVIRFTMKRYAPRTIPGLTTGSLNDLATLGTRTFGPRERIEGSVTLPIQPGISDSSNVEWGQSDLNAANAYLASRSLGTIKNGGDFLQTISSFSSSILTDIMRIVKDPSIRDAISVYVAEQATSTNNLLSRVSGGILNPNMELLFSGPQLRPFSFTFRLSPRSQSEATQVRKIIRFFKQGMSVKRASSDIFLKAPNVFDVSYISYRNDGSEMEHPSIGRIKTCALTGFDVDYTPDGSYMTFNDEKRTMTSYQINMRFTELEPVTESDFYNTSRQIPFFDSSTSTNTRFVQSSLADDDIGF